MADNHSTGNSRPAKIPTERRVTVGSLHYEYPPRKDEPPRSPGRFRRVPWLQMRGDWLAAAGFDSQTPVRVRVTPGGLVLTVDEA